MVLFGRFMLSAILRKFILHFEISSSSVTESRAYKLTLVVQIFSLFSKALRETI